MKSGGNFGGMEDLEVIFPELRESEDERIRKAIGAAICGATAISILEANGTNLPDALSYLEKLKEQKPNIELIKRSWYMEGYTDGEFKREPMWNLVTGKGGPKYEENEKYGQPLEKKEWSEEDLPKWKKTKPERGKAFGAGPWYPSGIMNDNGKHVVFFRGYEISVDELFDKLPKED